MSQRLRLRRTSDDAVICDPLVLGDSFMQRFLGLMGRGSLPAGEGLYLPDSSIHMMFMRFPIDALFLSKAGVDGHRTVMGLRHSLPTWRGIAIQRGADGVVELPAGTLQQLAVAVDDEVAFEPDAGTAGDTDREPSSP